MNIVKTIATRKSCRTYNGLHLEASVLEKIDVLCQQQANGPDDHEPRIFNTIPRPIIRLLRDFSASGMLGTYGVIKGARSFMAMAAGKKPAEQLIAGYIFEKLILQCTAMGIDTCWLGGTFGKTGFQTEFYKTQEDVKPSAHDRDQTSEQPSITIVSPLGHRTPHTRFAERIMRKMVSADTRKPFPELFHGITPPSDTIIQRYAAMHEPPAIPINPAQLEERVATILECVRQAPSSTNSQPWRANVCRNLKGRITGIAMTSLGTGKLAYYDMGIAYCHLIESSRFLGINGILEENSSTDPSQLFFSLMA